MRNCIVLLVLIAYTISFSYCKAQNAVVKQENGSLVLEKIRGAKQLNVVFILSDDHRYDALGFLKTQPFIKTPHMDMLDKEGA